MKDYYESQRFSYLILPILILQMIAIGVIGYNLYRQLVLGIPSGDQPLSDGGLVLTAAGLFLVLGLVDWLLISARLEIRVDRAGLHYKYFPFIRSWRSLERRDIARYEVRRYDALKEYGGWGYRPLGKKKGLGLNVWGSQGLHLGLMDGRKLMLGTQQPRELEAAMQAYMKQAVYE